MEARMHKFYYKKIETYCTCRFWDVSQFSKFIFVVCNVWYNSWKTLFALLDAEILPFTILNVSTSIPKKDT